jgi:hypothetical protein
MEKSGDEGRIGTGESGGGGLGGGKAGVGQPGAGKSGYETIYEWVAAELPGFDLAGNAPHLGLEVHPGGGVVVRLLGRDYLVERGGVEPMDGRPAHFNRKSLAAHYAMSPGRGGPSMDFVKLGVLSGVPMATLGSFDRDAISAPLARRFESDPEALDRAVASLGGRPVDLAAGVGKGYDIPALPLVPMRLIFQPADEEFGAEFTLLHDRKSIEFMQFEALGFLGGALVEDLVRFAD